MFRFTLISSSVSSSGSCFVSLFRSFDRVFPLAFSQGASGKKGLTSWTVPCHSLAHSPRPSRAKGLKSRKKRENKSCKNSTHTHGHRWKDRTRQHTGTRNHPHVKKYFGTQSKQAHPVTMVGSHARARWLEKKQNKKQTHTHVLVVTSVRIRIRITIKSIIIITIIIA